jgi:DNA end-binding protein Ku
MYHADELRDFKQVPKGENVKVSEKELELGVGLIDRLTSEEFDPENYKDEYRIRVLGMLDEKSKGKEIVIDKAPAPKHGQVIDIMEALKRSMERVPAKKRPATATVAKNRKRSS